MMVLAGWLSLEVRCQTWCPPGAEFWYEHLSAGEAGYVHAMYAGDTLIDGQPAQRLEQYATGYDFWADVPYYHQRPPVLTRSIAGQVSYRESDAWHILFDLDVPPGGQWPMTGFGFEDWIVQVLDTGNMVVDGIALRWSQVAFTSPGGFMVADTAIERIGYKNVFLEPWRTLMLDGDVLGLRCYADQEVNYNTGLVATCDLILSAEEYLGPMGVKASPNPGDGRVVLHMPSTSVCAVDFIDAIGRVRLSISSASGSVEVDAGRLDPGTYHIRFDDSQRISIVKWIKQ